jgi:hypothetical protein
MTTHLTTSHGSVIIGIYPQKTAMETTYSYIDTLTTDSDLDTFWELTTEEDVPQESIDEDLKTLDYM